MDPALIRELKSLLGADNVLSHAEDLLLYEFEHVVLVRIRDPSPIGNNLK